MIQLDASYAGNCTILTRGFCLIAATRTHLNVTAGNSAARVTVSLEWFMPNFLQGYDGVSGGNPFVIGDESTAWKSCVPRVTPQSGAITTLGTHTGRFRRRGKTILAEVDVQDHDGRNRSKRHAGFASLHRRVKHYVGTCYSYSSPKSGAASIIPSVSGTGVMNLWAPLARRSLRTAPRSRRRSNTRFHKRNRRRRCVGLMVSTPGAAQCRKTGDHGCETPIAPRLENSASGSGLAFAVR